MEGPVARKPNPNHKRGQFVCGWAVYCTCGWRSETTYGQGARADANAQWHYHRDQCEKAELV